MNTAAHVTHSPDGRIPLAVLPVRTASTPKLAHGRPASRAEATIFDHPTTGNAVTFHVTAAESQQALLDSIKNAKSSFAIETFEWHDDRAGNAVVNALAARIRAARARGKRFDVRVIIDGTGMKDRPGDRAIVDKLRAIGVDARVYNLPNGTLTHRKLYIQDGDQFITGGRNIGDEYLNRTYIGNDGQRHNGWHDLMLTVEGSETERILASFYQDWALVGGTVPDHVPATHPSETGATMVQSFGTDPDRNIYSIRRAHNAMIAGAQYEIVLEVPYLSDTEMLNNLIAAKQRRPGLSIKVIIPGVPEGSMEGAVMDIVDRQSAARLQAAGIDVRVFNGGHENGKALRRFSHLKALVVDRQIVSVGSANADARTFQSNHELNTVISDPNVAADLMNKVLLPDWQDAHAFDPSTAQARDPLTALRNGILGGLSGLF